MVTALTQAKEVKVSEGSVIQARKS